MIITIIGFLAAIITPLGGIFDNHRRAKLTREQLEVVRQALLGDQNAYDEKNLRVIGGYVGDRDWLPLLHRSEWGNQIKAWKWPDRDAAEVKEDNTGTGQPLSLWEEVEAEKEGWQGPYLSVPRDQYPGDTDSMQWRSGGDNYEFERRQTEGKLADAWGRSLLFWKDGTGSNTTLWIISEGPDRKSGWKDKAGNPVRPGSEGASYDPEAKESRDDITIKITPGEWYTPNKSAREEQTRQILEGIRNALLGPPDAFDPSGRRITGGYLGDLGEWPDLYKWDESSWIECQERGELTVLAQPRGLWDQSFAKGSGEQSAAQESGDNGFSWRGPYLPKPWGTGEAELLRDDWGEPLWFEFEEDQLIITSSGRDKEFDTDDDIQLVIDARGWQVGKITLEGSVIDENPPEIIETEAPGEEPPVAEEPKLEVLFYYHPTGEPVSTKDHGSIEPDPETLQKFNFKLELETGNNDYICTGPRLLVLNVNNSEQNQATVYIGPGGTQCPLPEKLILKVPNL